jgi:hypothetical protein
MASEQPTCKRLSDPRPLPSHGDFAEHATMASADYFGDLVSV